ncbi:MAG: isoprenylcysteine carboxylmethyltransferase family protein [Eudoraea sp.]|nr:isoprenylcysteine carboxylmethyltransferase family protein [Muriicola sp.]NNE01662.1 isoprenylcysteine carboxylmethyltransferase family protein [Eudoraea sp.]
MSLKIPPAIVFLCTAVLMYLVATFLPVGYFDFFGRYYVGAALASLAIVLGVVSLLQFFSAKTTIDPRKPQNSTKLVTGGVYRITRNPMYLALLLVLLAVGIYLGNAFNTLLAAGFVMYMNRFQIIPEETALKKHFGKEYEQYCVRIRRWF